MKLTGALLLLGAALLLISEGGVYSVCVSGMQALQALTPSIPWGVLMPVFQGEVITLSLCSRLWPLPSFTEKS